jgi:hypothetical protein
MGFSLGDLTSIAKEVIAATTDMTNDKAAKASISDEIVKKDEQTNRLNILYRNAHDECVTPYEVEHRNISGVIHTTITPAQSDTFGTDGRVTYFFPPTWTSSNPKLTANANGNPTTVEPFNELSQLTDPIDKIGLIATVNLLRNGQSSGASNRSLGNAYSPGQTSITLSSSSSFTVGRVLYIAGSGTSALVKITGISGTVISIFEIIEPNSTIAIGGSVVENIPGFTNSERQTLTSASYQRILNNLTSAISSTVTIWLDVLGNQRDQLKINAYIQGTAPADNLAALTDVKDTINNGVVPWLALPNTGVGARFTDAALTPLASHYNSRASLIPTRVNQIIAALGVITQSPKGELSGSGCYLQRFNCLGFKINTANGSAHQSNGLKTSMTTFEDKIKNNSSKLTTLSNVVKSTLLTKPPDNDNLEVKSTAGFNIGDLITIAGDNFADMNVTIVSIVGNVIKTSAPPIKDPPATIAAAAAATSAPPEPAVPPPNISIIKNLLS